MSHRGLQGLFIPMDHSLKRSGNRLISFEVLDQHIQRYLGILTKQIHDPVVDPVRHLIVKIPDIDPLGDVLGEWPVGDDPVEQISFNGVRG